MSISLSNDDSNYKRFYSLASRLAAVDHFSAWLSHKGPLTLSTSQHRRDTCR